MDNYGVALAVLGSISGGGGCIRQSINFHAPRTTKITTAVAIQKRIDDSTYSASVSIRSANPKSKSVNPPLLWVERTSRTLL